MKRLLIFLLIPVFVFSGCGRSERYSDTRLLMDTVCTVTAGGANAEAAVEAAFSEISRIADEVDYYSDASSVSEVNSATADVPVKLSDDVYSMLKAALDVSEKSGGAFDITVAPVKDIWHFQDGDHQPPSESEIRTALENVGYKNLILDGENKTVTKKSDKIKIDLGGAAKGYAADRAAEILKQKGVPYALLDLGGNIYVYGKNPSRRDGKWLVAIKKPFSDANEYSETVLTEGGAVVTSGTYQRYFEYDGRLYHHILNPQTGMPTNSGIASASIVCDSALTADCLSTACMVLGKTDGEALAKKYGCRLITVEE